MTTPAFCVEVNERSQVTALVVDGVNILRAGVAKAVLTLEANRPARVVIEIAAYGAGRIGVMHADVVKCCSVCHVAVCPDCELMVCGHESSTGAFCKCPVPPNPERPDPPDESMPPTGTDEDPF